MGDTHSHATLPGVGHPLCSWLRWVVMESRCQYYWGAGITGVIGCAAVLFIREQTRIKDDAAMGIVLSVFFGAGVVILGVIKDAREVAGLDHLSMARLPRW